MTTTITLAALDTGVALANAQQVYGVFVGVLAILAGVGIGSYIWTRLRGGAMSI